MRLTILVVYAALSALCATPSQAADLYNNINATTSTPDPIAALGPLADSFSTGASATKVSDISVLLQEVAIDPPGDSTTITLNNDDNTSPGPVIATIGTVLDNELQLSPTVYIFDTDIALTANTRYWVELTSTSNSAAGWDYSYDTSGTGVANEYYYDNGLVRSNDSGPYQMKVSSVSAAPEPSTWLLMIVGIGGIGVPLRRAKEALGGCGPTLA